MTINLRAENCTQAVWLCNKASPPEVEAPEPVSRKGVCPTAHHNRLWLVALHDLTEVRIGTEACQDDASLDQGL